MTRTTNIDIKSHNFITCYKTIIVTEKEREKNHKKQLNRIWLRWDREEILHPYPNYKIQEISIFQIQSD